MKYPRRKKNYVKNESVSGPPFRVVPVVQAMGNAVLCVRKTGDWRTRKWDLRRVP